MSLMDFYFEEKAKPAASFLEFVPQTGQPNKDPKVKKLVRKHARNYVSRAKGIQKTLPLLQFQLAVPDAFGDEPGTAVKDGDTVNDLLEDLNGIESLNIVGDLGAESLLEMDFSQDSSFLDSADQMMLAKTSNQNGESHWCEDEYASLSLVAENALKVVETPSIPAKVVRERARKSKPKSGCKTCRDRHLKCDNSKPSCMRCIKAGSKCEGNASPGRLTAKSSAANAFRFELSQYCPSVCLPFASEDEAQYFTLFKDETAIELSGVFPSSFWHYIVPQESHIQEFVRHAVVSIAALNRSIKLETVAKQSGGSASTIHREAVKHREFALRQYGKSLKAMRGISWQEKRHLRKVLIATLLVIVFETMVMQPDLAYRHALIGDRLICHWLDSNPPAMPHTMGLLSPVSVVVEDELLMMFGRYDAQLMVFVDHREVEIHQCGKVTCQDTVARMPDIFYCLIDASSYWQVVMRLASHYLFTSAAATESASFEKPFEETVPGRVLEMNSSTSIYCSPYLIPDELEEEKAIFMDHVVRWSAAFDPLWRQVHQGATDLQDIIAASILRMYSLSMRILIDGTTFTSESAYDRFLPYFQEIVLLARFIDDNLQPSYHFHLSTAPPLFVVLLRCRDPSIRREAIATLRATRVDGPWDRWMIAKVGEWIMQVEEEGMDTLVGAIEEFRRVRLTRLVIGMQERKVWVQCVRIEWSDNEPTRKLAWVEKAISDW